MPDLLEPDRLPDLLHPGMTVFVQSSSSEPTALINAIAERPECCGGVHFVACQIPGLNRTDFAGLHPEAKFTGLFVTPEIATSYRDGSVRFMPLSYSGMYRYLEGQSIDLALIQVAPTDADGTYCLGTSVHFVPSILNQAKTVVAEVNDSLPRLGRSYAIDAERLDYAVPVSHALPSLDTGTPSDVARKIGAHVAELVRDGDHVQIGIGKVPSAVLEALHDHQRLSCYGGLIGDAMIDLDDAGAVDPAADMVCTSVIGTKRVYDWVQDRTNVLVLPVSQTHDVRSLAGLRRLVAINSVLAVDLGGQANAETVNGRQVGGCGGLPDFVRGARLSDGGKSILALPSTASRGKISRIVPHVGNDSVSSPRIDADFVVTEHGVADLGSKSIDERAEAMIAVADPRFRDQLLDDWRCRR